MTTVKNIYDYINSFAPFDTQEEWDNSGILIGNKKKEVKTCVVSLDVTNDVLETAIVQNADLIVTHHPVIFSKLSSIQGNSVVFKAIQRDISVISAHTNLDIANDGINDALANQLELENVAKGEDACLRFGKLPRKMNSSELADYVKEKLGSACVRHSSSTKAISSVAVCGGSGSDFIKNAMTQADAFVTGDASYHNILDAREEDFCLLSAGHFETEIFGVKGLCKKLSEIFTDVEFVLSNQKNPIEVV